MFKVLTCIHTNFIVTAKGGDDEDFGELYVFKWMTLLMSPITLIMINLVGVVAVYCMPSIADINLGDLCFKNSSLLFGSYSIYSLS